VVIDGLDIETFCTCPCTLAFSCINRTSKSKGMPAQDSIREFVDYATNWIKRTYSPAEEVDELSIHEIAHETVDQSGKPKAWKDRLRRKID
jgi:hypothetical protein